MSGLRLKSSAYHNPLISRDCGQILVERSEGVWTLLEPAEASEIVRVYARLAGLREKVEAMQYPAATSLLVAGINCGLREVLDLLDEPAEPS